MPRKIIKNYDDAGKVSWNENAWENFDLDSGGGVNDDECNKSKNKELGGRSESFKMSFSKECVCMWCADETNNKEYNKWQ